MFGLGLAAGRSERWQLVWFSAFVGVATLSTLWLIAGAGTRDHDTFWAFALLSSLCAVMCAYKLGNLLRVRAIKL